MSRQTEPRMEWFTVSQVGRLLGVSRQTIYTAVKDGRMRATGSGWQRRIHAEDVLRYAMHSGKDVQTVAERMKAERNDIPWDRILSWGLAAAGLVWLLTKLRDDGGGKDG
jgi:excisionase family DNA binding protein